MLIVVSIIGALGLVFHVDEVRVVPMQKIYINRASAAELTQIPKLRRSVAEAIVDLREKLGGFKNYEQIDQVKGVGEKTLRKIREWTVLGN